MPYNTNPIQKNRDITGQAQLPLARVKRIISHDSDISMCSNNAAFVITIAAELFVQHLAEQGLVVVKSEKKPRRNIQYRDLAQAVATRDNLEFLSDIIPKTVRFKEVKERKPPATAALPLTNGIEAGQTTLDGTTPPTTTNGNGVAHEEGEEDPNAQLRIEAKTNGHETDGDVEMS